MSTKPVAVFIGFIGKLPMAGMALANLHMISGLQRNGYEVHYVERQNEPNDCYDPRTNTMTDDSSYAREYLWSILPRYGVARHRISFIDADNRCHGAGWVDLARTIEAADFVLTLADPTWFDELGACARRAYVDADPLFTQAALEDEESLMARALAQYEVLFTYGVRMGEPDCMIPTGGRDWIPARMAIETSWWPVAPITPGLPVTSLLNWSSGSEVTVQGKAYGYKSREVERFIGVPARSHLPFALAIGGSAPKGRLRDHGWELVNPLTVTETVGAYQRFIAGSFADLGIAKHAYVASRSGWFSDRSTCYMASGRPVLHQDTGCGDWLPVGEGVLLFSDIEELVAGLEELEADYDRHARAARATAEKYFEARTAIGNMLDAGGLR